MILQKKIDLRKLEKKVGLCRKYTDYIRFLFGEDFKEMEIESKLDFRAI